MSWIEDALDKHRHYSPWWPGDDYMNGPGDSWSSALFYDSWGEVQWPVDDMNKVVDYQFFGVSDEGATVDEGATALTLALWVIHPRKGASRAVVFRRVTQEQLQEVEQWLRHAITAQVQTLPVMRGVIA